MSKCKHSREYARTYYWANVERLRVFPVVLIALNCAAAAVYAAHGDVRRCIYWFAAAALTATVTF